MTSELYQEFFHEHLQGAAGSALHDEHAPEFSWFLSFVRSGEGRVECRRVHPTRLPFAKGRGIF
jgi:hypothetical protein